MAIAEAEYKQAELNYQNSVNDAERSEDYTVLELYLCRNWIKCAVNWLLMGASESRRNGTRLKMDYRGRNDAAKKQLITGPRKQ